MTARRSSVRSVISLGILVALFVGCGTTKQSSTPRTGTEQLLLTSAWDRALAKVDFRPLTGVPVFLDTTHVTALDQAWVISSLRQAMLSQGVLIRSKQEQAQFILEARVGAYGTDAYNWMIGVPQVTVPQTIPGVPAGTIPEMPFIKKSDQKAIAKLALFAYDRGSGRIVWSSGTVLDSANAKDVYIGGLGPLQSGTIRQGTEFNAITIPRLSASEDDDMSLKRDDRLESASGLRMGRSADEADFESFRP